jgi:transcriptional regulator with XRE-family HTH domain
MQRNQALADLGHGLRRLRLDRGLTQEALADLCNLHPTYIAGLEKGRRNPSYLTLCALARGLGLPLSGLAMSLEAIQR